MEFEFLVDHKNLKFLEECLGVDDAGGAISEARNCYEELTSGHDDFRMSYSDVRRANDALYARLVETCGRNDGFFKKRKVDRVTLVLLYHVSLLCKIFTRPR